MADNDLLVSIGQSGEIEKWVAEQAGTWDHGIWLEFRERIFSRYGVVDQDQLGLLLEEEKRRYWSRHSPSPNQTDNGNPFVQIGEQLSASGVSKEQIEAIICRALAKLNRSPVIVVMGGTGVGKTKTCNAIFGKDLFEVSHSKPGTLDTQASEAGELILVDVPGLGEWDEGKANQWRKLYESILREGVRLPGQAAPLPVDAVLWVLNAEDRKLGEEGRFYREVFKKLCDPQQWSRLVCALNKVDIVPPAHGPDGWQYPQHLPGPGQIPTIKEKQAYIGSLFDKSPSQVIPYSAEQRYNLDFLLEELVRALPPSRAPFVVHQAQENEQRTGQRVVSEPTKQIAEAGFWKTVAEEAQEVADRVAEAAIHVAQKAWEGAKKVGKAISVLLKRWF